MIRICSCEIYKYSLSISHKPVQNQIPLQTGILQVEITPILLQPVYQQVYQKLHNLIHCVVMVYSKCVQS